MIIPEELKALFGKYRGTGIFNISDVNEYILRWNTYNKARTMTIMKWLEYVVGFSESIIKENGFDENDYVDYNIDLWIEMWRNCHDGLVHFLTDSARKFHNEGLVDIVVDNYCVQKDKKYSLVRFK